MNVYLYTGSHRVNRVAAVIQVRPETSKNESWQCKLVFQSTGLDRRSLFSNPAAWLRKQIEWAKKMMTIFDPVSGINNEMQHSDMARTRFLFGHHRVTSESLRRQQYAWTRQNFRHSLMNHCDQQKYKSVAAIDRPAY